MCNASSISQPKYSKTASARQKSQSVCILGVHVAQNNHLVNVNIQFTRALARFKELED